MELISLSRTFLLTVYEDGLSHVWASLKPLSTNKAIAMDLQFITANGSSLMFTVNEVSSSWYYISWKNQSWIKVICNRNIYSSKVEHTQKIDYSSNHYSILIVSVTTVILVLATCMKLTVISYILPKDRSTKQNDCVLPEL